MKYTYENIDKIVEFKTWTIKQKLDELFRIDCDMYTNLGIESTKKERDEVKRMSEQLTSQKLLDVYKEKANLKEKEVTFDEFLKEAYKQ